MVDEYAETLMAQRISMVNGVAQVNVMGAQKYAVRAQLDPEPAGGARHRHRRSASGAVERTTSICPPARCGARSQAFTVQANGQLMNAAAFRPLIVAYRNGRPVRLEDLGRVVDSVQNDKAASWFNDAPLHHRSLVQRQPGTNTVEVVDRIKELLPELPRSRCRPRSSWISSTTARESIRESVDDVKFTLVLTVGLVVLVIFLFLRNVSATMIPSLALPMSVVGTFAAMYAAAATPWTTFADGADALGGLRGGRRHRDAGEHRPPHGNGQAAHAGGARGRAARSASRSFP